MKVLVVDDHAIVREGLKALLEFEEDIEVVYEAGSGKECFEMLDRCSPDVVLLDLKMPGIGGIDTARIIKSKFPQIKIILLTNYDDEEYVVQAIKARVDGYVLKDVKKGDLATIIRRVLQGDGFIDPAVTPKVFHHLKNMKEYKKQYSRPLLTQREFQIMECVIEGKSNKEIAEILFLSLDTVKTHLKNIYQKLGVGKRSQAIREVVKGGLLNITH